MKYLAYFVCLIYTTYVVSSAPGPVELANPISPKHNLGAKQCTWGPSYWCSNLTASARCRATKHCIQTVWEHQTVPEDSDSVCDICLDMVKQARDQLLSNETEEEIKEVFEGSCKLIPIKIINKECCKLVDDFIPELVDTLASQMNPQVVCSVAGLCNNVRIDGLLAQYAVEKPKLDRCYGCHTVMNILEQRFETMSKDEVLQSLLRVCGHMSSLSDSCSNIVVTYFKDIYQHLQKNFNSDNMCLLSGECSAKFHTHVEVTPLSKVGYVPVGDVNDDLPCELCEQLVGHLRDILVANTTEMQFKKVLEGLCNQTGQFRVECTALIDQYYPVIYDFLVRELNGTEACQMIGICPKTSAVENIPIVPLLPAESANKAYNLLHDNEEDLARVNVDNNKLTVKIMSKPEHMQLPIERLFPKVPETYNRQVCVFCQYFLHYLQTAITNPSTEERIKKEIDKACGILPSSVNETCIAFVNTYGDAMVALLAQEIDPSTICPLIRACPAEDADDVEIFREDNVAQDACPLCLFAVTELEEMVKDKKTEESVRKALDKLCSHFSGNLAAECQDFVDAYSDSLINMLVDNLKPQQICVFIKLCQPTLSKKPLEALPSHEDLDVLSNEIPDLTVNGVVIVKEPLQNNAGCIMCEFAMDKIQKILQNQTTEDEIENAVLSICNHLPQSVRSECTAFVKKYSDIVIKLLIASVEPEEICTYLGLCEKLERTNNAMIIDLPAEDLQSIKPVGSPQCAVCKSIMTLVEKLIIGPTSKKQIIDDLYGICDILPNTEEKSCENFIGKYGDAIADMILAAMQPSEICSILMVCEDIREKIEEEISDCSLCEAVYFNFNFLQHTRGRVLPEHVCNPMTKKYVKPCLNLLEKHAFAMSMYSSSDEEPTAVCQELDYCKGNSAYIHN